MERIEKKRVSSHSTLCIRFALCRTDKEKDGEDAGDSLRSACCLGLHLCRTMKEKMKGGGIRRRESIGNDSL